MLRFISILIVSIIFLSCKKDKAGDQKKIEFILLKSYQFLPGKCRVDASTVILEDAPVVSNNEIITYSDKEHSYNLDGTAIQK